MISIDLSCARERRLCLTVQTCLIIKRFRKLFASLHNQEKKLFVFPNTPLDQLILPNGIGVCKSVEDFKIKTLKGGFHRRPELLMNCSALPSCDVDEMWNELPVLDKYSSRYDKNKRIQGELVEKALNLCNDIDFRSENGRIDCEKVRKNKLILDIGCGSGTSSKPLLDMGYSCIGVDLSLQSLSEFQRSCMSQKKSFHVQDDIGDSDILMAQNGTYYEAHSSSAGKRDMGDMVDQKCYYSSSKNSFHGNAEDNSPGFADVLQWDLRHGLPFRAGTFDLAISISFLQWLFYGDRHNQLHLFFSSLKSLLRPQGKAVIQFYPRSAKQLTDSVQYAMKNFQGVLVGDYPHIDRGRKLFLVLFR